MNLSCTKILHGQRSAEEARFEVLFPQLFDDMDLEEEVRVESGSGGFAGGSWDAKKLTMR